MKRWMHLLLAALPASCLAQVVDFSNGHWVDLSHTYDESTIYWPTASEFHKRTVFEGHAPGGYFYSAYDIETAEHGGTHLDAPVHFFEGALAADELPIEQLAGPAIVIDIREQASGSRDYLLSVADLEAWEAANGPISAGDMVLIFTGFSRYWPDAKQYLGTAQRGEDAVEKLHFPGLDPAAARFLAGKKVAAIGIDTASIDFGQTRDYPAHQVLGEFGIPAFENLADLSEVPSRGAFLIAAPMKIGGGSGAPARILAFVPSP